MFTSTSQYELSTSQYEQSVATEAAQLLVEVDPY